MFSNIKDGFGRVLQCPSFHSPGTADDSWLGQRPCCQIPQGAKKSPWFGSLELLWHIVMSLEYGLGLGKPSPIAQVSELLKFSQKVCQSQGELADGFQILHFAA